MSFFFEKLFEKILLYFNIQVDKDKNDTNIS